MKYGKIFNIGSPEVKAVFDGRVVVEEKVDGSQFRVWFDENRAIHFGSKSVDYSDEVPPDKMFLTAIEQAKKHFANKSFESCLFVFEYLLGPKQNAIQYERVPEDNLLLLEVKTPDGLLRPDEKKKMAEELGFECVPVLKGGEFSSAGDVQDLLETKSMLGGSNVEGIVIKNYSKFYEHGFLAGSPVFAKYVREEFRELNAKEWGVGKTPEERIMENFPVEPRWRKVVQQLREKGGLTNGVKDIGLLITAVQDDFVLEGEEFAKEFLWHQYSHKLKRRVTRGLPEWYKKKLLEESF